MNYIIANANQKGGVGKTTITRETGIFIARTGKKTLLVDIDPQGNLTKSLMDEPDTGLYEALCGNDYEVQEVMPDLFLLAGSIKLAGLEKALIGEIDAYTRLKELLADVLFNDFDYIMFDCPPSLGVLTVNALTAADCFLIPMNPALYSLQGTNDLMQTVSKVRNNLNKDLALLGVVINAFDSIPVITRQIREEIETVFGSKVFKTALSKSIKIEEAIAERSGVVSLKKGKVKDEIELISRELIQRVEGAIASCFLSKRDSGSGAGMTGIVKGAL